MTDVWVLTYTDDCWEPFTNVVGVYESAAAARHHAMADIVSGLRKNAHPEVLLWQKSPIGENAYELNWSWHVEPFTIEADHP